MVLRRAANTRIVHQDVDSPERRHGLVARPLDTSRVGDVDVERKNTLATIGQFLRRPCAARRVAIPDRDCGAGIEEALRDGATDPLCASGDDRKAAIQIDPVGHVRPPCRSILPQSRASAPFRPRPARPSPWSE